MRSVGIAIVFGVVLVVGSGASASLILVHDNGGPNVADGQVSDPTFPLFVSDDFTINQTYGITRVTWLGAYKNGDMLPNGADSFSLKFYSFGGTSTPSPTPIATASFSSVLRQMTQWTMFSGNPVFSYQADFPSISLASGRYLLSIVNDTTGLPEQWVWQKHSVASGSLHWQRFNQNSAWLGPFGSEMSFRVYAVPEAGTGVLAGIAALMLLRRCGRK